MDLFMEDTLGEAKSQSERPVIETGSTVAADTGGIAVIGDEEDSERSLTWEETANVLVDAAAVTESLGLMHYYSFAAVGVSDVAAASQPAASIPSSSSSAAATSSPLSPMEVRDENTGTAIVMDDKSAPPLPRCHTESTDVFSKQTFGVNAQANLVTEGGAIHNKGERVLFLLSDMGPLLYTAAISLLFAMFLLDLGYYDMVVVAYLQRYHSKQLCDRLFGLIEELLRLCITMSIEAFGMLVQTIFCNKETGLKMEFFLVNPLAMTNFKAYMAGLYNCSPTGGGLKQFFMDELQRHWFCMVRPGALDDPAFKTLLHKKIKVFEDTEEYSLYDKFSKILPEADGWAGTCYSLDDDYTFVDWFYLRRADPIAPRSLESLALFDGISSVKTRKEKKAGMGGGVPTDDGGAGRVGDDDGGDDGDDDGGDGGDDDGGDGDGDDDGDDDVSSSSSSSGSSGGGGGGGGGGKGLEARLKQLTSLASTILLPENENALRTCGYAGSKLMGGVWPTVRVQYETEKGKLTRDDYTTDMCLGDNWGSMTAAEAWRLKLPPRTAVDAVGLNPKRTESPIQPFPALPGTTFCSDLVAFAELHGGSIPARMEKRTTLGDLLDFLSTRHAKLLNLTQLCAVLKGRFRQDYHDVWTWRLGGLQRLREDMCVPPKPQTAQQLFQLARSEELKAGDPKADVSKKRLKADGEAHKAANDGEWGEFDSAAVAGRAQYRNKQELYLKRVHQQPAPTKPWTLEAIAEMKASKKKSSGEAATKKKTTTTTTTKKPSKGKKKKKKADAWDTEEEEEEEGKGGGGGVAATEAAAALTRRVAVVAAARAQASQQG